MKCLATLILSCLLALTLASPFPSPQLFSRDDPPPAINASPPAINATILDHNNNDITSLFQIKLYTQPPSPPPSTLTNLTDRRRQPATLSRPIMDCPLVGSVFVDSVCTYEDGAANGMQAYELSCFLPPHHVTGNYHPFNPYTHPVLAVRTGHCHSNEVCVDGLGRGGGSRHGQHSVASCVSTDWFVGMARNSGKGAGGRTKPLFAGGGLGEEGEGENSGGGGQKQVRMVASEGDGGTVLEVDRFEVEALDEGGKVVLDESCRDCTELRTTGGLGGGVEGLRASVRLLTAGGVGGILWLAVVSG